MGNYFSNASNVSTETSRVNELEKEVASLKALLQQQNGSSGVTNAIRVHELEREVDALRELNEEMRQQVRSGREHTLRAIGGGLSAVKVSSISHEKLMAWVDDQLQNQESNSKWIPDFAERKLKADIFAMILGMVDHILETTKIEVMGHVIRFDLTQE